MGQFMVCGMTDGSVHGLGDEGWVSPWSGGGRWGGGFPLEVPSNQ